MVACDFALRLSLIAFLFILSTSAESSSVRSLETRYLAFQVFTDSLDPHSGAGSDASASGPPDRRTLDDFALDLIDRLGSTGDSRNRLALMFGPISFEHSDQSVARLISDVFDIALSRGVAVGFHLDDSMFWRNRADLLGDPQNIERMGWNGPLSAGRRLDWGPIPTVLAPQMCINSPVIEAEVIRRGRDIIGASLAQGLARLKDADREDLFVGVIVGWETQIGRDVTSPGTPLGYCVMANLGIGPQTGAAEMDRARVGAVAHFIDLWSKAVVAAGVPVERIYSHIAFAPREYFDPKQANATYEQAVNFATIDTAFGGSHRAGFSTYPTPGLLGEIYAAAHSRNNQPWASAEGANVNLTNAVLSRGNAGSGMSTETYLARHFNHGAVIVNIFGWGLGDSTNPFRAAAERPEAIAAYAKFLAGATLNEGPPTIFERLPEKMRRINLDVAAWIAGRMDRLALAQPHFDALTSALQGGDLVSAEREADALLALTHDHL